jgi:putative phosphotransacetylase
MLMGPNGFFEMPDGVIRALRHASEPDRCDFYGVKHGDMMKLKIGGDCGIILDKMLARVDEFQTGGPQTRRATCNFQPDTPVELIK